MPGKRVVPPRVGRHGQGVRPGLQGDLPDRIRDWLARRGQLLVLPEKMERLQRPPVANQDWLRQLIHVLKVIVTALLGLTGLWIMLAFLLEALWAVAALILLLVAMRFLWIKG